MVVQRYHDRFYRFYGILVSIAYAIWIIIGFTFDFNPWIIFLLPVPFIIIIYLAWYIIKYYTTPEEERTSENQEYLVDPSSLKREEFKVYKE